MFGKFLLKIIFISLFLFILPLYAFGQQIDLNIDPNYDLFGRQDLRAELIRTTKNLYFYIESDWWKNRTSQEQNNINIALFELGEEFNNKIYPNLISTFGSEPKPGIDGNERIFVLIHQMGSDSGGYLRTGDAYSRFEYPLSNEREIVYLNSKYILTPLSKSFLAHEFLHLITTNQKDLLNLVNEEIWLNETRAEAAITLLGYNTPYRGSNLERRVRSFVANPINS